MGSYKDILNCSVHKKKGRSKVIVVVFLLLVLSLVAYFVYKSQIPPQPTQQIPSHQQTQVKEEKVATQTKILPVKEEKTEVVDKPHEAKPIGLKYCPIENTIRTATAKTNFIVYGGFPENQKHERNFEILKNIAFTVGYSEKREDPLWVAYRVDKTTNPIFFKRPGYFKADNRTIARVKSKDYSRSGYDRGHMAPNAAIVSRYGRKAQFETFTMSNIVPQRPKLNRRVWKRLEGLEMRYANKLEKIWVITGPIFDEHIEKLKEKVEIPDSFYKILIDEKDNHIRTLQFIVPQSVKGKERLETFLTSIDKIEKVTHLDFFQPLSDKYENYLESKIPDRLWPQK